MWRVVWIYRAQEREYWNTAVSTVMNIRVPEIS